MAQRRRRKHRGTQAGTVKRARSRPRSRAEARGSSEQRRQQRLNEPPTWRGAFTRGAIAAVSLFALATFLLGASIGESIGLSLFAAAIYVPAFHAVDTFAYRRRQRKLKEPAE
jgi:Flp pilus assembly protein TadB